VTFMRELIDEMFDNPRLRFREEVRSANKAISEARTSGERLRTTIPKAPRSRLLHAIVTIGVFVAATPLFAHHSFTMFDLTKKSTLNGTVTTFEWTNPHSYIEIDVPDDQGGANPGGVRHWSIEMGSPSILQQAGWKFSSLKKGDKTTLIISPLKNGKDGGFLDTATMPDGRVLRNGPAPNTQQ
jgi:hypothetical protein